MRFPRSTLLHIFSLILIVKTNFIQFRNPSYTSHCMDLLYSSFHFRRFRRAFLAADDVMPVHFLYTFQNCLWKWKKGEWSKGERERGVVCLAGRVIFCPGVKELFPGTVEKQQLAAILQLQLMHHRPAETPARPPLMVSPIKPVAQPRMGFRSLGERRRGGGGIRSVQSSWMLFSHWGHSVSQHKRLLSPKWVKTSPHWLSDLHIQSPYRAESVDPELCVMSFVKIWLHHASGLRVSFTVSFIFPFMWGGSEENQWVWTIFTLHSTLYTLTVRL